MSFNLVTARIDYLEYRVKLLEKQVKDYQSGDRYLKIESHYREIINKFKTENRHLRLALAAANLERKRVRNLWIDANDYLYDECEKMVAAHQKEIEKLLKEIARINKKLEAEHERYLEKVREYYALASELAEEQEKNQKLTAQINRDSENSSIPSSKSRKRKKISNSREKTYRKPGAQPGHPHHGRKKQEPTTPDVMLVPDEEILNDLDYKATGKYIIKQKVDITLTVNVTNYKAEVYRNSKTNETYHAPFPEGLTDDVNYGGNIKAFLFMLNNECCVSIDKCSRFLKELTDGKLEISKGMINKLSREFASKTEKERKQIFLDIVASPVIHIDNTNAKVNGKSAYVTVNATPDGKVYYSASTSKGHESVKGTPAELTNAIMIHDHDKTYYNYGSNHQECLAHVLRYLKDSIENEKERTWSTKMHALIQEMIHYRNGYKNTEPIPDSVIAEFDRRYNEIINIAKTEYEYEPPGKYYRDGYNLYLKMEKYKSNHLLFLHDLRIDATNNEAEQLLRTYKRKQAQAVSFRSQDSIDYLCQCMSVLFMMRQSKEDNVFGEVSKIFA